MIPREAFKDPDSKGAKWIMFFDKLFSIITIVFIIIGVLQVVAVVGAIIHYSMIS